MTLSIFKIILSSLVAQNFALVSTGHDSELARRDEVYYIKQHSKRCAGGRRGCTIPLFANPSSLGNPYRNYNKHTIRVTRYSPQRHIIGLSSGWHSTPSIDWEYDERSQRREPSSDRGYTEPPPAREPISDWGHTDGPPRSEASSEWGHTDRPPHMQSRPPAKEKVNCHKYIRLDNVYHEEFEQNLKLAIFCALRNRRDYPNLSKIQPQLLRKFIFEQFLEKSFSMDEFFDLLRSNFITDLVHYEKEIESFIDYFYRHHSFKVRFERGPYSSKIINGNKYTSQLIGLFRTHFSYFNNPKSLVEFVLSNLAYDTLTLDVNLLYQYANYDVHSYNKISDIIRQFAFDNKIQLSIRNYSNEGRSIVSRQKDKDQKVPVNQANNTISE